MFCFKASKFSLVSIEPRHQIFKLVCYNTLIISPSKLSLTYLLAGFLNLSLSQYDLVLMNILTHSLLL